MQIRNENVSCSTCKHRYKSPKTRNCKKCVSKNDYPGWEPGPGVTVQETKGWIITGAGKPVEAIFRKVVE